MEPQEQLTSSIVKRTFGEKVASYLKANGNDDVTFLVGPNRVEVKAPTVALKATCPGLDKRFKEQWDLGVGREEGGIPLPYLNPEAFRIFVELLLEDDWPIEQIQGMNLQLDMMLNLISISKQFEMMDLQDLFLALAANFFKDFAAFAQTDEFLHLSCDHLEIILSSDELQAEEIEIFKGAYKWAENQCLAQKKDPSGENIRGVLGDGLFKIRFPLLKVSEFVGTVCPTGILTVPEQHEILMFTLREHSIPNASVSMTRFPSSTRKSVDETNTDTSTIVPVHGPPGQVHTVNLIEGVPIVNNPSFECDGNLKAVYLNVSEGIALESVRFLGPIVKDAEYTVGLIVYKSTVEPGPADIPNRTSTQIGGARTTVRAHRHTIFSVSFDEPIPLEPYAMSSTSEFTPDYSYYRIDFCLRGPNTQSADRVTGSSWQESVRAEADGVVIYSSKLHHQLAELVFKKI